MLNRLIISIVGVLAFMLSSGVGYAWVNDKIVKGESHGSSFINEIIPPSLITLNSVDGFYYKHNTSNNFITEIAREKSYVPES